MSEFTCFAFGLLLSAIVAKSYKDKIHSETYGPDGKWLNPIQTREEIARCHEQYRCLKYGALSPEGARVMDKVLHASRQLQIKCNDRRL